MAYTRPAASSADASWQGLAIYTRPGASSAGASWEPSGYSLDIAASVPITAGLDAAHGVAGTGAASVTVTADAGSVHGVATTMAASVSVSASIEAEFTEPGYSLSIVASVVVSAGLDAAHGVAGSGTAAIEASATVQAAHGVAASVAAAVPVSAGLAAAHGVAGTGAATVEAAADIVGQVTRYEVAGEVRIGGVLVDRRVRVYSRDTGVLIGQADTAAGLFRVHAGFAADEVLVLPVDLSPSASDWSPPAANRVVPVLALDA